MSKPFYTSVAKNVQAGHMVTVRGSKVVILRGAPKPGQRIGVWSAPQVTAFIGPDGAYTEHRSPGGFQVKGSAQVMAMEALRK